MVGCKIQHQPLFKKKICVFYCSVAGGVSGGGWGGGEGVAGATPAQGAAAGTWSSQPRDRQGCSYFFFGSLVLPAS